jgi:hypothetical protein
MRTIESGKHKGKTLAQCPKKYIEWASKHEGNFARRNQWVSRDAKILLERMGKEEAARQAAASKIARLEQLVAEGNFLASMDLKMTNFIVGKKVEQKVETTDISTKGNLYSNKGFQILR